MADKKISPKKPEGTEEKTPKDAATRVTKKRTQRQSHRQSHRQA